MYPELPEIAGFALKSYAFLCAIAMIAALLPVRSEARRLGWSVEGMSWLVFTSTLVGWIGAHVLYALTRLDLPVAQWWPLLLNVGVGSVWYGGFLASWVLVHRYARRHRLDPLRMYDVAVFAVMTAQAIGRIGCVLGGCCYGTPTTLPWGIVLPRGDHAHTPIHPVPIYEALFLTALFAGLWMTRRRRPAGQTAALYLALSSAARFALEFLRGDSIRGFVWGWLSTSQGVALLLIAAAALLYFVTLARASEPNALSSAAE
jgi:phosphatidylglycerol:prolipoprotein diacylglycerol transferase